jgi:hypothetical protein
MKYQIKCAIIGRKKNKEKENYYALVSLFHKNDAHLTGEVPEHVLEFEDIEKVLINGLNVDYHLLGNDLVLNNLESIDVELKGKTIHISGSQK